MTVSQRPQTATGRARIAAAPLLVEYRRDHRVDQLLADLSAGKSWGRRQRAARKLGYIGDPAALPALLAALPGDPFWMVRCAIIQALEKIGDARAVPTLQRVQAGDRFQLVRSHAAKAINTLQSFQPHGGPSAD
jgi:HEAT repeat protein